MGKSSRAVDSGTKTGLTPGPYVLRGLYIKHTKKTSKADGASGSDAGPVPSGGDAGQEPSGGDARQGRPLTEYELWRKDAWRRLNRLLLFNLIRERGIVP